MHSRAIPNLSSPAATFAEVVEEVEVVLAAFFQLPRMLRGDAVLFHIERFKLFPIFGVWLKDGRRGSRNEFSCEAVKAVAFAAVRKGKFCWLTVIK